MYGEKGALSNVSLECLKAGTEIDMDMIGGEGNLKWNEDEQAYLMDPSKEIDLCGAVAVATGIIKADDLAHFSEWHELGSDDG